MEKEDDNTKYSILEKQDRLSGYLDSPVVLESIQSNLTPRADPVIDNLPEGVGDDNAWNFDGAICEEFAQRVGVKRKLLDLQNECRAKKRRVLTNVAEAVDLA